MSTELGDFAGVVGLVARTTGVDAPALTLRLPASAPVSTTGADAAELESTPTAPQRALRRIRSVHTLCSAGLALVSAIGALAFGDVLLALVVLGWLGAELLVLYSRHSLNELDAPRRTAKRNALYLLSACAIGLVVGARPQALRVVSVLGCLALAELVVSGLTARPRVRRALGVPPCGVLVVGSAQVATEVMAASAGRVVAGVCSDNPESFDPGVPVLGGLDDVASVARQLGVGEVVVGLAGPLDGEWVRRLCWSLEELGIALTVVTGLRGVTTSRVEFSPAAGSVFIGIEQRRPVGVVRRVKSIVEAVVAAALLLVSLPLLVTCMLAVWIDSPGPVFFRQERVCQGGRTFRMVKLRTMRPGAQELQGELAPLNEVDGALFKISDDPRVTRVGRLLRKLSLDELPQFVHVVTGRMSLIGPRPALPSEVAMYDDAARRRLAVKPGMTGLWQVSGRSRLTWDESIALDVDYVDNWSASRDVKIAVETIRAVASREGAY